MNIKMETSSKSRWFVSLALIFGTAMGFFTAPRLLPVIRYLAGWVV